MKQLKLAILGMMSIILFGYGAVDAAQKKKIESPEKKDLANKASGKFEGYKEIKKISELDGIIDEIKKQNRNNEDYKIFVGIDWDNTISKINGCYLPFREGNETKKVLIGLKNRKKVQLFVITSRSRSPKSFYSKKYIDKNMEEGVDLLKDLKKYRYNLSSYFFSDFIKIIVQKFGSNIFDNSLGAESSDNANYANYVTKGEDTIKDAVAFYTHGIVSVPGSGSQQTHDKGEALKKLIEKTSGGMDFRKDKDYLVFVDNAEQHVEQVKNSLSGFVNFYAVYYPQNPELELDVHVRECGKTIEK